MVSTTLNPTKRARATMAEEAERRDQAIKAMHPQLRAAYKRFQKVITERSTENVMWFYSLGRDVVHIQDHPEEYLTPEEQARHENPIAILEYVLGAKTVAAQTMSRAAQFVEAYSTADRDALLALRSPLDKDWRITWAHVIQLVSITDATLREKVAAAAAEQALSPSALRMAIRKKYGGQRKAGGRKLSWPKSIAGQVYQVRDITRLFVERCEKTWAGKQNNVYQNLLNQPPESYTSETRQDVQAIVDAMELAAEKAKEQAKQARGVLAHIDKCRESNGVAHSGAGAAIARARRAANH